MPLFILNSVPYNCNTKNVSLYGIGSTDTMTEYLVSTVDTDGLGPTLLMLKGF